MSSRLSDHQRAALLVLDRSFRTGNGLAARMVTLLGRPTPPIEGLHQTLASLVRRGLARRQLIGGTVHYELTDDGSELVRKLTGRRRAAADA